jgi:hypothetical protein
LPGASERPYGGWFDEVADALEAGLTVRGRLRTMPSSGSSSTAAS